MGGGLGRLADDGHARGVGALGLADGEGDDVDVEAAEERGDAGEDAGFVLDEGYEGVEHRSSQFSVISCQLMVRCGWVSETRSRFPSGMTNKMGGVDQGYCTSATRVA